LWRTYRARGLVVIGASVDRGAPRPLIDPYVKNLGLTFPILLDAEMKTAGAWRVNGIPTTFVIRPGGDVVGMAVGPRDWNGREMRALLETLLPDAHGHGTRCPRRAHTHVISSPCGWASASSSPPITLHWSRTGDEAAPVHADS